MSDAKNSPEYAEGYSDAWDGVVTLPMTPEYRAGYEAGKRALATLKAAGFELVDAEYVIRGCIKR